MKSAARIATNTLLCFASFAVAVAQAPKDPGARGSVEQASTGTALPGTAEATDPAVRTKQKEGNQKRPKLTSMNVTNGTLTVDGWTGKAELNYDIANLHYLYFYAPGIGTAIVSSAPFPGSIEQQNAFSQGALTIMLDGHMIQLASSSHLIRGKKDESAWVKLDATYTRASSFPMMGYGETLSPPYAWPGAKPQGASQLATAAPPLPQQMRPTLLSSPCGGTPTSPCALGAQSAAGIDSEASALAVSSTSAMTRSISLPASPNKPSDSGSGSSQH